MKEVKEHKTSLTTIVTSTPSAVITTLSIILCIAFFLFMVIMELILESVSRKFSTKIINGFSLSLLVTLFQFLGCTLTPLFVPSFKYKYPSSYKLLLFYFGLAFLVYCSTGLSTLSVSYVSYPTKVVFKSAKLVPTMMMSTVINGKRYNWKDYSAALFLCLGAICYTFDMSSVTNSSSALSSITQFEGIILLLIAIICDAIVPNLQQALMAWYELTAEDIMLHVNLIGMVSILIVLQLKGVWSETAQHFNFNDPVGLLPHLLGIGLSLGLAVNCYTNLIKVSGSVLAVAVATIRKIVTILLSYLIFPKLLSIQQMFGAVAVTIGILIEGYKHK